MMRKLLLEKTKWEYLSVNLTGYLRQQNLYIVEKFYIYTYLVMYNLWT